MGIVLYSFSQPQHLVIIKYQTAEEDIGILECFFYGLGSVERSYR
jgi:hypothetical protein